MTPQYGLGYALGIIGSLMMRALLLYPLRKHWRPLARAGSMQLWFTTQAALGIIGPALVLIHANFSLKSTNATVATIIMLSVVFSGIVGRYIYSRIHLGMAGRKTKLSELLEDVEALRNAFGEDMEHAPGIEAELKAYEDQAQAFRKSTLGSFRATLFLGATSRRSQSIVKKK